MAEDSVQPVPCVCFVGMRGASNRTRPVAIDENIDGLWGPWRGPLSAARRSRRARASASPVRSSPPRPGLWHRPAAVAASGMFGVTTTASGMSMVRTASTALSSSKGSPLCATMTGSTTTGTPGNAFSPSTTASMIPSVPSMPILTATTLRSFATSASAPARIPAAPQHALDRQGVLRRQRRNRGRAMHPERGEGPQIRLECRRRPPSRSLRWSARWPSWPVLSTELMPARSLSRCWQARGTARSSRRRSASWSW